MSWLTDPFALDILQRTLIAGLLTAVAGAVVGTWVVIRGLTFMGDALAHGVLPGIAVAVLLAAPATAQDDPGGGILTVKESTHFDVSPPLREIVPVPPARGWIPSPGAAAYPPVHGTSRSKRRA